MLRKSIFILGVCFSFHYVNAQWYSLVSGTTKNLFAVDFKDAQNGIAVGGSLDESSIIQTSDGGNSWQMTSFSNSKFLYDVLYLGGDTIISCGYAGIVYKSTDNGLTWSMKPSQTTEWLYKMHFISSSIGFAVGSKGTIIKTTNSGNNWTAKNAGTSILLLGISFANDTLGFAVGRTGRIIKTIDAGETWINLNNQYLETLNSVFALNTDTIWAVGELGRIIKSQDGGETWEAINLDVETNLTSIVFVNSKAGYIVGNKKIFRTYDAGETWIEEINPLLTDLQGIAMIQNEAYIVGKEGTVLKNTQIPLNIGEFKHKTDIVLFPNPAKSYFQILNLEHSKIDLELFSINGQMLLKQQQIDSSTQINTENLPPGIYLCKVYHLHQVYFNKIIIE